MANDFCSDCEEYDGTYVLRKHAGFPIPICIWEYEISEPPCQMDAIRLSIFWSTIRTKYVIRVDLLGGDPAWAAEFANKPDCASLSNYELPWDHDDYNVCDGTVCTCTITAL